MDNKYKYKVDYLDWVISLSYKYKGKGKFTEDFIEGLKIARKLLWTEDDERKLSEDFLNGNLD